MTVPGDDRRWIRIALYCAIAFGLSWLARVQLQTSTVTDPKLGLAAMYWHLFGGVGPFLGAVAVWAAFRPERPITFTGSSPAFASVMLVVPAAVLGAIGIDNRFAVEPHLFGAHMGLLIVAYALLEETGWRGYLQSEFRHRPPLLRYVVVGLFWYAWHFSYVDGGPLLGEIVNLVVLVLAAVGIGFVADRTRSIFAAASFHAAGNILAMSAEFKALIPQTGTRAMIAGACVLIWLVIMRLWRIRETRSGAPGQAGAGEAR